MSTTFCELYAEMVQGQQILVFYPTIVHIANDCGYKILCFWANPQKYQTLVPTKNSHLKVHVHTCINSGEAVPSNFSIDNTHSLTALLHTSF